MKHLQAYDKNWSISFYKVHIKSTLIALEFETPCEKNDLVRYNDPYGRTLKPYEKGKNLKKNIKLYKLVNLKAIKQKMSLKIRILFFENHQVLKQ